VRSEQRATFKRRCLHQKKKLADVWRKPTGMHNKQRRLLKAKGPMPNSGYGSPAAVRGLHPSGFAEVLVYNPDGLEGLNNETQAIRIAGSVGGKKRAAIQEKAIAAGLKILNPKERRSPENETEEGNSDE
ncbi:50S ribosomal protein L32e, partial [bacterium]